MHRMLRMYYAALPKRIHLGNNKVYKFKGPGWRFYKKSTNIYRRLHFEWLI